MKRNGDGHSLRGSGSLTWSDRRHHLLDEAIECDSPNCDEDRFIQESLRTYYTSRL